MKKIYKSYGIPLATPQEIFSIKIESKFGENSAMVVNTSSTVLEFQAVSTIIESEHPPEGITQVKPLTLGGVFEVSDFSCVYVAKELDEVSCIELNFISDTGSDIASLISPPTKNLFPDSIEYHYLNVIIDRLTNNGHPRILSKATILEIVEEVFTSMTTVSNFIYEEWEKQYAA